jgi:hypothetical protein
VSSARANLTGVKGIYLAVPVENGAIFFRTNSNMDMNVNPTINIVFGNAPSDIRNDLPIINIIDLIEVSVREVFRRLKSHIK